MPRIIQPSFARGVISPALFGRVDTAAYQVALRLARNLIIHPYGGASSRDGLRFLEPVKDHSQEQRLIPFEFKTEDQYNLEFGDQYIRVMRNDAHVLDTSEQEIITGITQANPGVVTTSASHGYSTGQEVFLSGVVGMTEVNNKRFKIGTTTSTTFQILDQVDSTNVDTTGFTAYSSAGTVDLIYEIVTPYLEAELFDLTFVQDADVMTICHKNHASRELSRLDHDDWTLATIDFVPTQAHPTGMSVTVNTTGTETRDYSVTAINSDGKESLLAQSSSTKVISAITQANPAAVTVTTAHNYVTGDEIVFGNIGGMDELDNRRFVITVTGSTTFTLNDEDSTNHSAYTSGGGTALTYIRITNSNLTEDNTVNWSAATGAVRYGIYRRDNGIWGIIGESTQLTFTDNNFAPDTQESPPTFSNPFLNNNHPGAVSFYQQRRVFGGSTNFPDTSWLSQVGAISNFSARSPIQDDDAITASLTSRQVNEIRQYVPGTDLVTFTSGAEWTITAGTENTLTPSTIQQRPQTNWGSSYLPPIEIGRSIIYVQKDQTSVRNHGYSLQLDGYTGTDLMIFAEHLLENDTIKDWSFTHNPETRLHLVLASGNALTFTFDQEQEVIAWSTWDTSGKFKTCTYLHGNGPINAEDSIYYVVERTINGRTVKYIEVWRQRFFNEVEDCFFVDSGLTLDNPSDITGVSLANPVVITSVGHNLSNGDLIDIEDIVWVNNFDSVFNETPPTQLNGFRFKVANVTSNTFELTDQDDNNIDGSSYNAYVSGGVWRKAVTALSGLDHLEGEAVVALTDGNVESSLTVSGGAVTLPRAASRVQIGLRFISDLETLDLEPSQGTVQGKRKKIASVTVRFRRSRGLLIGPNSGQLEEMKQREFEKMGEPTQLLTGDKIIDIAPSWNTNGRLFLRQKDPLPMTILAIVPEVVEGDDEE